MRLSKELLFPLAALLAGLWVSRAHACDPPSSEKMARQIGVMEKIVNQVLVDSPNFFIQERENCRGMYFKDVGLVFTFSASLVEKDWDLDKILKWGDVTIEKDDEGGYTVKSGKKGRPTAKDDPEDEDLADITESDILQKQERTYLRGKTELIDIILDYGDTLSTLDTGKSFVLCGFLRDSSYFTEKGFTRLVLKAKIDDLRLYAAEKISEEQMIRRIVETTY